LITGEQVDSVERERRGAAEAVTVKRAVASERRAEECIMFGSRSSGFVNVERCIGKEESKRKGGKRFLFVSREASRAESPFDLSTNRLVSNLLLYL